MNQKKHEQRIDNGMNIAYGMGILIGIFMYYFNCPLIAFANGIIYFMWGLYKIVKTHKNKR